MKHRVAIEYLPEAGSGVLDVDTEEALATHAEGCRACRSWLATRDLLAGESAPRNGRWASDHPDSELLALCVVRPQELRESSRQDLRRHLARCRTCREDMSRLDAAVGDARPGRKSLGHRDTLAPALRRVRWSMAAALVTAFLGGGLLVGVLSLMGRGTVERAPVASPASLPDPVEVLSGRELDGITVINRKRGLVVSQVTVKSGADVTLCAGDGVALGDGFRVAPGARLSVGSTRVEGSQPRSHDCRGHAGLQDRPREPL